jgi:hypothetical protein
MNADIYKYFNCSLVIVRIQSDSQCRINSNPDYDFLSVQSGLAI